MKTDIDSLVNTWDWSNMSGRDIMEWAQCASVSYKLIDRWQGLADAPRVLDLGCGAGRNSVFFAQCGFRVSGLDIDDNPLGIARSLAKNLNKEIDYTQGDMRKIPYPDNSFDAVYADNILSLTSFNGLKRAISEIHRILRPGGEAFIELLRTDHECASSCWKFGAHKYTGQAQYGLHTVPFTFLTHDDIPDLLKDFDIIDESGSIHGYKPYPGIFQILAAKRGANTK